MADKRPPKPYETFPLFAHAKGYWCKKIEGKQETFGRWAWPNPEEYEKSWKEALRLFKILDEARATGQALRARPGEITLGTVTDAFLTRQEGRVENGITARSFAQNREIVNEFRDAIGRDVRITHLEANPDAVLRYREGTDRAYGWHAYNKRMAILSQMFKWAEDPLEGILPRAFRLRPLFKRKGEVDRKREKRAKEAETGKMRWTPDELVALFSHAPNPLRCWMRLGYFAAFGNSDCADVPTAAFNFTPDAALQLPPGWATLEWLRPKTGIERGAVLPKDVVDDLIECQKMRSEPAEKAWAKLVFLTRCAGQKGRPLVRDIVHRDAEGQILKTVSIDGIGQEFRRLRDSLGRCDAHGWFSSIVRVGRGYRSDKKVAKPKRQKNPCRPVPPPCCPTCSAKLRPMRKLSFYVFRHTAITYASGVAGADALAYFEGHAIQGVRKHYVEEIDVHVLKSIAERLLKKLDPPDASATRNDGTSTPSAPEASIVAA